jgi:hypothetical protein
MDLSRARDGIVKMRARRRLALSSRAAFDRLGLVRRILAGLLLGAFLALIGVQAAHAHEGASPASDACAVCALAHQAQRRAPAGSPSLEVPRSWTPISVGSESFDGAAPAVAADARAPPSAS